MRNDDVALAVPQSELRRLLTLAWPLILSNSFSTIQITVDRLFLSQLGTDAVAGTTFAVMLFWTPFILFHCTSSYAATFVAQYTGAGRPHRVGPAVWQAIYFSLIAGVGILALVPFADQIISLIDHSPELQRIETTFFIFLCWMALPALLVASISGFFSGRGESRTIIWINLAGMIVNAILDYLLIFGNCGFRALGVAGAGWATMLSMWVSAFVGLVLMFRPRFRRKFATLAGWRFDPALFWRLLRFGIPSGAQWTLDMTAFTTFLMLMGWLGRTQIAASTLVVTINNLAFIPMLGVGQAVSVLVGQRLGHNQPQLAQKSTYTGFWVAGAYMVVIGALYVLAPSLFIEPFRSADTPQQWEEVAAQVRVLLWFVAFYSVFDSMNIVFSFALRGAGDTLFVTYVALFLAWPIMVLPTWFAVKNHWGMYWAWGFASTYIVIQALCFIGRFRGGKWKSMRVIEPGPAEILDE